MIENDLRIVAINHVETDEWYIFVWDKASRPLLPEAVGQWEANPRLDFRAEDADMVMQKAAALGELEVE